MTYALIHISTIFSQVTANDFILLGRGCLAVSLNCLKWLNRHAVLVFTRVKFQVIYKIFTSTDERKYSCLL